MAEAIQDVVILVPDFGGSTLERDGQPVWGGAGPAGLGALVAGGRDLVELLRLGADDPSDRADGVRATGIASGPVVLPGVWKTDAHGRIPALLGRLVDVEPGDNYVELAWDWRQDLRVAARTLETVAAERLAARRERAGGDVRVVLVGLGAGALVARYYLEVLDGWKTARTLVAFGAPFHGTPAALGALTGASLPSEAADLGLADVLRTFTSLHQLLPAYPVVELDDDRLVRVDETDLLDAGRVADGARFHAEIAEAMSRHANSPAYREGRPALHAIVGTAQSTPQSVRVQDGQVRVLHSYHHRDLSGDGIVPRASAQPAGHEEGHGTLLTSTRHASLHADDRALSYLLGVMASLFLGAGPAAPPVRRQVGVDLVVPDVARAGEPFRVRVLPEAGAVSGLRARLEPADGGAAAATAADLHPAAERWHEGTLTAPSRGIFRVRVEGGGDVQPLADLVEVLG